ncbi:MAG: CCA tRNA nucleotidyltransferase [Clostridia bacterium]|nr:CCA tRNA nucleotidyltransferase [Clostridia bacterium]
MDIDIPRGAELIIERLEELGHRADIVGGPVRDALLGRTPYDFDITTSARPDEITAAFSDMRVVETGIAHGTVTVIVDGENYEVTTYRIDGEYKDGRHPESVTFTAAIEDDLSRRDFTVNAMAYSKKHGLTDKFSGKEDLAARLIRAVGDPRRRFEEDALRILRALRFASVLGFEIEENTARAVKECRELLRLVSVERIYAEWSKLIGGSNAYGILSEFSEVVAVFLPELDGVTLPRKDLFDSASATARFISLFAENLEKNAAESFEVAARRLKTDAHIRKVGRLTLENLHLKTDTKTDVLHLLSKVGEECAELVISVRAVLGISRFSDLDILQKALADGEAFKISDLDIDGAELVAAGLRGPSVGAALSELLALVIDGKLPNNKEALVAYILNKT